jgi:hypothetical protein
MSTFGEVSEVLRGRVPRLVQHIDRFSQTEPWSLLAVEDRTNALPDVVERACTLALGVTAGHEECLLLIESAAHHGFVRRNQGLSESTIFDELAFVREAIWADIQSRFGGESRATAEVILRIDMALTLASQASLRGYFQAEFVQRGLWPRALTELESAWSPPRIASGKTNGKAGWRNSGRTGGGFGRNAGGSIDGSMMSGAMGGAMSGAMGTEPARGGEADGKAEPGPGAGSVGTQGETTGENAERGGLPGLGDRPLIF